MKKDKDRRSYTEAYQTHEGCGYGYKVVCCYDDKYSKYTRIYRGENAVYKFMEKMLEELKYCKTVIKKHFNKPLVMTEVDERNFKTMDWCHICCEKYTDKDVRVRDHCHITGKFRGSAHQECNLKLRIKPENLKIPIIFHNLRGYDSHFIMQRIGEIANKLGYTNKKGENQNFNFNAIPNNMEKYMAFMLGNHLTFIDSFQFMSFSLDKLVNNLPKDDIIYTSKAFKGKRLNLMSQKGVYPCDVMSKISKIDLGKYKADGKKGLILEVDLEYTQELHDIHNDHPVTPEKAKVSNNMLSAYCKKIAEKYNIIIGLVSKLIPTWRDKKEYLLHYHNLQLYLDLGLKIKKVHQVLKFDQSPWLKQYIDFITEKRKHAKNSFEKEFFKLMNNGVFGKTLENLHKQVDIRLVTNEKKLDKVTAKPTYVSFKIFNENLTAVHKVKKMLTLNRTAYVGMCILDLNKMLMYDFHYNYIKEKYNNRVRLLFTDTDSLIYEIEAKNVYKDFWNDKDMFDNSDYLESSPYYCIVNKKIFGKFKDEACGIPITEFIGLKSKMYSYIKDNEKGGKTSRSIKKEYNQE